MASFGFASTRFAQLTPEKRPSHMHDSRSVRLDSSSAAMRSRCETVVKRRAAGLIKQNEKGTSSMTWEPCGVKRRHSEQKSFSRACIYHRRFVLSLSTTDTPAAQVTSAATVISHAAFLSSFDHNNIHTCIQLQITPHLFDLFNPHIVLNLLKFS